jgi:hypothetical protein
MPRNRHCANGDIVAHVRQRYAAKPSVHWACYHTRMWEWTSDGIQYGIIGRAVGGSFSVMIAEQLFASGCQLLISVASAGQITDVGPPPYWILIERALRARATIICPLHLALMRTVRSSIVQPTRLRLRVGMCIEAPRGRRMRRFERRPKA